MHSPNEKGKVTRGCVDRKFVEACEAAKRRRRPTAKQKRDAAASCLAYQEPPRWSAVPLALGAVGLVILLVVILSAGCVPVEAIDQARTEAAINAGHALDERLPLEARQVGADNSRAWAAQAEILGADPAVELPEFPAALDAVTPRSE